MTVDMTSFAGAFKELYPSDKVRDLTYKNRPALAMIPKATDFYGDSVKEPVVYGNPQSRSSTFSRALTRSTAANVTTAVAGFDITRVKDYGVVVVDREAWKASQNNEGAFLKARQIEMDGVLNSLSNSLSGALYRSGFGAIGRVANSSFATTTMTLSTPEDVVNFEVGMELDLSTAEDSALLKAYGTSTNGLIITGIDRSAGTLTFGFNLSDATNGIPTIAQNDFIFVRGDRQNSATPARLKIAGFEAWVPAATPSATLFFNVNRTADASRLGGLRYNGAAQPIEEAIIDALRLGGREGASTSHIFVSYDRYADLEKGLQGRKQYVESKVGAVSFRGIEFNGPGSVVQVYPDKDCPVTRAFALQLDTWKLRSLGSAPEVFEEDLEALREATTDAYQIRAGYYANASCRAPGWNINIQL